MPFFLLITVAAQLAAGLVLQNGGAVPAINIREALRARQYVLLNTCDGGRARHCRLPEMGIDRGQMDFELLAESADHIAQSASLDTAGFDAVAATRSTAAMATFVNRLLDSQNLRVKDEAFMLSLLPYYTGECANQSFDLLSQQLLAAKEPRSCHPAWVVRKFGKGLHGGNRHMQLHTVRDTEKAAVMLVKGVMAELGAMTQPGHGEELRSFAAKLVANNRSVTDLQNQLPHKRFRTWVNFVEPAHEPTFVDKGPFSSWLPDLGTAAPLNEGGYRAVLHSRNDEEMSSFIRRAAKKEGLKVVDDAALFGLTPYFSGLCAHQSYKALVNELHSLVGRSFTVKVDLEASSNDPPSIIDLQATIAQATGVAVGQVTIGDLDPGKLLRRLERRERRAGDQPVTMDISEGLVDASTIAPSVADDAAHGSAERKGFEVTIAVDSAPKVHDIKQWVKAAPVLPGVTSATLFKVKSSKPAQCGGGVLVPK